MNNYEEPSIINIGCGIDYSIKEMAEAIKDITGFTGELVFDSSKPDGTMQKLLDVSKLNNQGWTHTINLLNGLASTYKDFSERYEYYITKKRINTEPVNV